MFVIANWKIQINIVILFYYKTFFTQDFQHYDIDVLFNQKKKGVTLIVIWLTKYLVSFLDNQRT